jgi:hypothetical protein
MTRETTIGCLIAASIGCTMLWGAFCVLCLLAGNEAPLFLSWDLLFGWTAFLGRVAPQIIINLEGVAAAIICLVGLTIGLNAFLTWLYAQIHASRAPATPAPRWHLRWTATILAVVVLMFVAGIAAVGLVHQWAWLRRTPLVWRSQEHLQLIGRASARYQDKHQAYPPGATYDNQGRMLHGWMTLFLPYIYHEEYKALAQQIDLTVPWDDPRNAVAFRSIVAEYQCQDYAPQPKHDDAGRALSHYASNVHVISGDRTLAPKDITDGMSYTILAGEVADNFRPWGYPVNWRDPGLGLNRSPDGFGNAQRKGAYFTFLDGNVRFLANDVDPKVLKALSTPAGGEKVAVPEY